MSTFVNFSIITGFFYFLSVPLFAANRDTLPVFELKEITVFAERASANTSDNSGFSGGNIFVAEKTVLNTLQHSSLSDYLSQHTAVFIRENGQGMFSTVSLRGTASSHTSVSWNGLPVNSLTMGQTDFSQLPLFFFDRVAIHPGGEGAIYGNGSIGGNISLSSRPEFGKKHSFLLQETAGSFGYTFTGAKIQTGNKNIQSKTAFFFNRANNDFSFSYRDREERQKNAAYHKMFHPDNHKPNDQLENFAV